MSKTLRDIEYISNVKLLKKHIDRLIDEESGVAGLDLVNIVLANTAGISCIRYDIYTRKLYISIGDLDIVYSYSDDAPSLIEYRFRKIIC